MNSMYFYRNISNKIEKQFIGFMYDEIFEFIYDSDFIYANAKFFNDIDDFFFKSYRDKNLCFLEPVSIKDNKLLIFYCKNSTEYYTFNINDFPVINLYQKKINFTFKLTYEDLFEEINGIYYFLIVYDLKETNNWKLGKPFLKKYSLVFDAENQTIGFYDKETLLLGIKNDDNRSENKKSEIKYNDTTKINTIIIIVLLVIFNILLIILIINITNKCKKRRKKKIYEVESEDDEFMESKNNDLKTSINSI